MDRNHFGANTAMIIAKSLSARRAWIEIKRSALTRWACTVALRKESVDRNGHVVNHYVHHVKSLSARRAWIEITALHTALNPLRRVALRKESVDRNTFYRIDGISMKVRRSPQGERG